MTREDREAEIEDYVQYLDRIADRIRLSVPGEPRIEVHGFSQGAATACRWVAFGSTRVDRLVVWGSALPPDLPLERYGDRLTRAGLTIAIGTRDKYLAPADVDREEARLRSEGTRTDHASFRRRTPDRLRGAPPARHQGDFAMMSFADSLAAIYARELATLRMEVEAYPSDRDLWKPVPGIANSGGTLSLHLAGNLLHFIGGVLGGTGYRRNRDAEFGDRDVPRAVILQQVDAAIHIVPKTVAELGPEVLDGEYPDAVAGVRLNTADFLLHLASHLSYHLGQLDYHRRIVTGGAPLGGVVSPTRLWSAVKPEPA